MRPVCRTRCAALDHPVTAIAGHTAACDPERMGIVQRLARRYATRADAAHARHVALSWPEPTPPRPVADPPELITAFRQSPSARVVYDSLQPEERNRLCWFVSSPWLRRNRTAHAHTVVRKCAEGVDAVRAWLDFNKTVWGMHQPSGALFQ